MSNKTQQTTANIYLIASSFSRLGNYDKLCKPKFMTTIEKFNQGQTRFDFIVRKIDTLGAIY